MQKCFWQLFPILRHFEAQLQTRERLIWSIFMLKILDKSDREETNRCCARRRFLPVIQDKNFLQENVQVEVNFKFEISPPDCTHKIQHITVHF